jgi:hypothetical protein
MANEGSEDTYIAPRQGLQRKNSANFRDLGRIPAGWLVSKAARYLLFRDESQDTTKPDRGRIGVGMAQVL